MSVTIGLHLICRNETESLRACLESVKPVKFDQIVVGITSKEGWEGETRQIVEEFGGEAVDLTWLPKFQFEDYGECIASFAQARNEVYKKLTTDWAFWLDADDVLDNAEELRPLIEKLDKQGYGCLLLPYFYGFDDNGNCITILTRERAVKRSIGWKWIRRVHEGLKALGPTKFARSADIVVLHRSPTGRGYPERNLKLLEMDYEENPNDKRTLCYIAHQYYALRDWANAALWYERYLRLESALEERWQALHFLADCYCLLGDYRRCIEKNLEAIVLFPDWADPYFGISEAYTRMGRYEKAVWWDKLGRMARVPDAAIFTNPLDYTYNPALFANIAYYHIGDLETARQIVIDALKVSPNSEHLKKKLEIYDYILELRTKAAGLLKFWEGAPDEAVLQTPIPPELMDVPEVRKRVTKAAFRQRSTDSPWAIFYCGKSLEEWGPPSLHKGGIGGSETAVIHMAKLLAKAGWHVDVFNDCGKYAGEYEGVGYWPYTWYKPDMEPDLLVGWRLPGLLLADAQARGKVKWLWVHDLHLGDNMTPERGHFFDRIMGVSEWHSDYLQMCYGFLNNLKPTRNGIDLSRFDRDVKRNPHKVVYASSPDRGLDYLLAMWPVILRAVPDAELHLYYGWQNIEKVPQLREFKQQVEKQIEVTPNVVWHGRVNQDELALEFLSAGCWFYPTGFLEVSCITAMEAMAAGLAILTSTCGALPETVGDRGILVPGYVASGRYQQMFIGFAVSLLTNTAFREKWAAKGKAYAPNFSWEGVAEEWLREWEDYVKA